MSSRNRTSTPVADSDQAHEQHAAGTQEPAPAAPSAGTQEPIGADTAGEPPPAEDDPETHIGAPTQNPHAPDAAGCNLDECTKPAAVRGLCDAHWASRRGDADPKTTEDRDE